MPLCIPIQDQIDKFRRAINSKTVGIHFRHGNGEDWWMAGKPKFNNLEEAVDQIIKSAEKNLEGSLDEYNFKIFSDSPSAKKIFFARGSV